MTVRGRLPNTLFGTIKAWMGATHSHDDAAESGDRDGAHDAVAAKPDGRTGAKRRMTHRPNAVFRWSRSIFRWAVRRDLLTDRSDLRARAADQPGKPRERTLSPAEITKFPAYAS